MTAACQTLKIGGTPALGIKDVLKWLPADTETLVVANGPFWKSDFGIGGDFSDRAVTNLELEKLFQRWTLARIGILRKTLDRERIELAAEGSRRFRPPKKLGLMPYEGCEFAVFAEDQSSCFDRFMGESAQVMKTEEIEHHKVAVFHQQAEKDIWTIFVANPLKNVIVVATNREYLQEVLQRINGKTGQRALPETLQEWEYVNRQARFWGLRHFKRAETKQDPTSPFNDNPGADENAVGITFECTPMKKQTATVRYLSSNPQIHRFVVEHLFPFDSDPRANQGLRIQYVDITPNIVECSLTLHRLDPTYYFFFILMGRLGHATYL